MVNINKDPDKIVEQVHATNAELDKRGISSWERISLPYQAVHLIESFNLRVEREGGIGEEQVWKGFTLLGCYKFHHQARRSDIPTALTDKWMPKLEWEDQPYRVVYANHMKRMVLSYVEGDIYLTYFPDELQGRERSKKDRVKAVTGFYRYMAQTSKFYEES